MSQIVIGIIVTVVGNIIADAVIKKDHGKRSFPAQHFSRSAHTR